MATDKTEEIPLEERTRTDNDDEPDVQETNLDDNDDILDQDNQDSDNLEFDDYIEGLLPNPPQTSEKQTVRLDRAAKLRKFKIANLDPYGGPDTSTFLDAIEFTVDKRTKNWDINGIEYNGEKVIVIDVNTDEFRYSTNKDKLPTQARESFKTMLAKAKAEIPDVNRSIDEHAGVFIPPEVSDDIISTTIEESLDNMDEMFSEVENIIYKSDSGVRQNLLSVLKEDDDVDPDAKEDIIRQLRTALTVGKLSEDELELTVEDRKKLIKGKLDPLDGPKVNDQQSSEKEKWLERAKNERDKAKLIAEQLKNQANTSDETNKLKDQQRVHLETAVLYDELADICELRADEMRLQLGLEPKHARVKEILKNNIDSEPRTKFEKFKDWAKKNLGALAAGAIAVAGIITTIVVAGRTAVVKGAQATSKFARGVYRVFKKLGPVFEILGKVLLTVLSLGAKGLLFLANNLWLLSVLVAYYLYDRYNRK